MEKLRPVIGISAVATAVLYAILWLAYSQFYFRIGLTPEEVGIDKVDLLSEALVGPVILFTGVAVTAALFLAFATLAMLLNIRLWRDLVGDFLDLWQRADGVTSPRVSLREKIFRGRATVMDFLSGSWRVARWVAVAAAIGSFVWVSSSLFVTSIAGGRKVIRGEAVGRPNVELAGLVTPILKIRATPVDVVSDDGANSFDGDTECLLYIGDSAGTTLIFSPNDGAMYRVPTGTVSLRLKPVWTQAASCVQT